MLEAWVRELPEHIIRGFRRAKGTDFQLRFLYELDRRGLETSSQTEAYIAAGGAETHAAQAASNALNRPGPKFVYEFLKSEPSEIRWFRLEGKALKATEKALDLVMDESRISLNRVKDIREAVSAFMSLADHLPHLLPEARKISAKLEAARTKFEPRDLTLKEIDEAIDALKRDRDRLAAGERKPEAPSH